MLYTVVKNILKVFYKVFFLAKYEGLENVLPEGGGFVCANHSSNWDPVSFVVGFKRHLTFMAKEELFRIPVVKSVIKAFGAYPIKRNKGDAGAVMAALRIVKNGELTIIFPEGKRMQKGERIEVKSGIIRLAIQAKAPIIPVAFNGRYRLFGKLRMYIGKPIYYNEYYENLPTKEELQQLANELMDTIYALVEENK